MALQLLRSETRCLYTVSLHAVCTRFLGRLLLLFVCRLLISPDRLLQESESYELMLPDCGVTSCRKVLLRWVEIFSLPSLREVVGHYHRLSSFSCDLVALATMTESQSPGRALFMRATYDVAYSLLLLVLLIWLLLIG